MMILDTYEKSLRLIGQRAPRTVAGADFVRPSNLFPWGGPMNGQHGRQEIVRALHRQFGFASVLETGTYRGTTTEFLGYVTGARIFTVESTPRFYHYARRRLAALPEVSVEYGDSRTFLRGLAARPEFPSGSVFCYLDAHWYADLPLAEELEILAARWPDAVVMIDDFEVPGDSGYGFDDYGPGSRLALELIPAEYLESTWTVTYPVLPSAAETGARRGCAVLLPRSFDPAGHAALGLRTIG